MPSCTFPRSGGRDSRPRAQPCLTRLLLRFVAQTAGSTISQWDRYSAGTAYTLMQKRYGTDLAKAEQAYRTSCPGTASIKHQCSWWHMTPRMLDACGYPAAVSPYKTHRRTWCTMREPRSRFLSAYFYAECSCRVARAVAARAWGLRADATPAPPALRPHTSSARRAPWQPDGSPVPLTARRGPPAVATQVCRRARHSAQAAPLARVRRPVE